MKIIAEFVDIRNSKRYFPGDTIDPPLTDEQIVRLTAALCIVADAGGAAQAGRGAAAQQPAVPADLAGKSKKELAAIATARGVDISDCRGAPEMIAKLTAAAAATA